MPERLKQTLVKGGRLVVRTAQRYRAAQLPVALRTGDVQRGH